MNADVTSDVHIGCRAEVENLNQAIEQTWRPEVKALRAEVERLRAALAPAHAAEVAMLFHDTYERLAPTFGYETREETRQFDPTSPNGALMIAVAGSVLRELCQI
jgi:hypothetical protein